MSGDGDGQRWAWLGLLKWSLSYTDGTHDSQAVPMDPDKLAFLEAVMKDGIIDENKRMKEILEQMTDAMDLFQQQQNGGCVQESTKNGDAIVDIDSLLQALDELRDIVEQIDFARNFCTLQGLPFLLGCIQEEVAVPRSIRMACLEILATLCQNNPPVQRQLLDLGSIKILSERFFTETNGQYQLRILQAISASVRNHQIAENVFCNVQQACEIFERGLQGSVKLQKRALFFLRALVTSDFADRARVQRFSSSIARAADNFLADEVDLEIRELTLGLLNTLLEQKKSVNVLLGERRNRIVSIGVRRVASLRKLRNEKNDSESHELDEWENLLVLLARAEPDTLPPTPETLLIGAYIPPPETLSQ